MLRLMIHNSSAKQKQGNHFGFKCSRVLGCLGTGSVLCMPLISLSLFSHNSFAVFVIKVISSGYDSADIFTYCGPHPLVVHIFRRMALINTLCDMSFCLTDFWCFILFCSF